MAAAQRLSSAIGQDDFIVELSKRIARAETDRSRHYVRILDIIKYCLPWRHIPEGNYVAGEELTDDIYDSIGQTVLEDFSADMLNTFTPQSMQWTNIKPVLAFNSADMAGMGQKLGRYKNVLFGEMERSNLYQALQESYFDLGHGTMALHIDDLEPSKPIFCQAIPTSDLLIDRGVWGEIDGRFRRWRVRVDQLHVRWPDIPKENLPVYSPGDLTDLLVTEGVFRDWSDKGNEKWQYVVFSGGSDVPGTIGASTDTGTLLLRREYIGQGSCPIVVARWSRDSQTAWGVGPTYRVMPEIKTANHLKYLSLANADRILDPPFTYEDDGVINFEQGIQPGVGIPKAAGSAPLQFFPSNFNLQYAETVINAAHETINRAHYQDRPTQLGKTPPSATQWADEAAERARRMGTPATNLVIELQYPIIKRFAYLLERRGKLPKIELNGEKVALEPDSPLLRAQKQDLVVRVQKFMEMIAGTFGPQILNIVIDQSAVTHLLADSMGVPTNIIRTQAQMAAAAKSLGQMTQQVPDLGKVSRLPPAPATGEPMPTGPGV
jgi:hypothetical protein